jgi:hypothetical protein
VEKVVSELFSSAKFSPNPNRNFDPNLHCRSYFLSMSDSAILR